MADIGTHPVDCEVVSLCAPNHTQLLEVHRRLPGGKFVGANIWEIVVVRQFAPLPIEHAAAVSARPFTIYWLGVETPNGRNQSS